MVWDLSPHHKTKVHTLQRFYIDPIGMEINGSKSYSSVGPVEDANLAVGAKDLWLD